MSIQVVKEHPDWPMMLSMDGFGSHTRVGEALELMAEHLIWSVQEEADSSHVNQSYDNQVALTDKRVQKEVLSRVRGQLKTVMNQYHLIAAMAAPVSSFDGVIWSKSFQAVNMHPHHRLSKEDWLNKIHSHLVTGAEAFHADDYSSYDAMPAAWKKLPVPVRQEIIRMIDVFHDNSLPGEPVWTKENIRALTKQQA